MASRTNSQFMVASLTEFISVWAVGGKASLSLTTSGGSATVAFNCNLGPPGAPHTRIPPSAPSPPPSSPPPRPRHRGPSEKEKNRQRAARHQADLARTAATASSTPSTGSVVGSVTESVTAASSPSTASVGPTTPPALCGSDSSSETTVQEKSLEVSSLDFKCDQCDYANVNKRGLEQHIRMKHRISQVDGIMDSDEETIEDIVTLQLDEAGDIIGPELAPNSSPPSKVYHPKAGVGYIEEEPSTREDGDTFMSYHFPDDPDAFVMPSGPQKGKRMPSIFEVFTLS